MALPTGAVLATQLTASEGELSDVGSRSAQGAAASPSRADKVNHSRISTLDGLRGLAVLMVVAFHYRAFNGLGSGGVDSWIWGVLDSAWMGVDLFFVLSGFLITGILADSRGGAHYFRNFYVRRGLRIVRCTFWSWRS